MATSPYFEKPESSWRGITEQLLNKHPLKPAELQRSATIAWRTLWQTTVGEGSLSVKLAELPTPATIVGYFFEILLARELEQLNPKLWRDNQSKDDKDLVYIPDVSQSIEIKTSGQSGFKIFGNRSASQVPANDLLVKKEKSGFYVTINFYGQVLTLIRFGWLDADDWDPQKSSTGQMSGLKKTAYEFKLIPIAGSYRQQAPVFLLKGIGPAVSDQFAELGIRTIGDLLRSKKELPGRLKRVIQDNQEFLDGCS